MCRCRKSPRIGFRPETARAKRDAVLTIGVLLFSTLVASPVHAATITWEDSGVVTSVSPWINFTLPGLTVGTPWSLQVSFDPNGPSAPGFGSTPASPCNVYQSGATTFTLGSYTYTMPKGQIFTNAILPQYGCVPQANGAIVFELGFTAAFTQEPGAWDLNPGILFYEYVDTAHKDGTLPTVPSQGIEIPLFTTFAPGLTYYDFAFDYPFPTFQGSLVSPTLVPEPVTFVMVGVGLAYGVRRFRRRARTPLGD